MKLHFQAIQDLSPKECQKRFRKKVFMTFFNTYGSKVHSLVDIEVQTLRVGLGR